MLEALFLFILYSGIQNLPVQSDTFDMIEEASGKVFRIYVESGESVFSIRMKDKSFSYSENFSVKNDTFFLEERFMNIGLFSFNLTYSPKRIRMVLPFSENTSWTYKGIESGPGFKKSIESKGYMAVEKDTIFIFNISRRESKEDTSMVAFDSDYNLYKITIQIPNIMGFHRILGFKSRNLVLVRR